MGLKNDIMLAGYASKAGIKPQTLKLFFFLMLVLIGLGTASKAYCGFVDRIIENTTGPAAVEQRCRKGEATLCASAGNMYRQGYKVKKDTDRAIELYRLGCSGGDSKSCYALYRIGYDDSRGRGTKANMPRAIQSFTAACEGSASGIYSGSACYELARLNFKGKYVQKDDSRGVELLRRGCIRFSSRACGDLGNILLAGSLVSRDVSGAVSAFSKACEGKDKDNNACLQLGLLFSNGEQVKRDIPEAAKYLAAACTFPDWIGTACYELARIYETELAGKKSEEEIYKLYRVACDQAKSGRTGKACVAAADRHLQGKGAKKEPNAVIHLYNRGCMLNDRESCRLSCEWNCKEGQPYACKAIKTGRIPLGVTNCFKL